MGKNKNKTKKERVFYSEVFSYLRDIKKVILFSVLIFVAFILIGFFVQPSDVLTQRLMEFIQQLIEKTSGMNQAELTSFLFFNNLWSSFLAVALGVFFGIFSFVSLMVNGYVLGFVGKLISNENGILILWRIFPHGIFELPALIISASMGIRLGMFIFEKKKIDFIKKNILLVFKTFVGVVVPLLVIAAIIEAGLIILLN